MDPVGAALLSFFVSWWIPWKLLYFNYFVLSIYVFVLLFSFIYVYRFLVKIAENIRKIAYIRVLQRANLSEGTPYEVFGPWVRWDKGPGPARFVASRRNAAQRVVMGPW